MIKLIASDMDGTLINSSHEISSRNLNAIRRAQESGIEFAIATGRDYSMVKPFLDKYQLKCEAIVMNGAEYRDCKGEVIESKGPYRGRVRHDGDRDFCPDVGAGSFTAARGKR